MPTHWWKKVQMFKSIEDDMNETAIKYRYVKISNNHL